MKCPACGKRIWFWQGISSDNGRGMIFDRHLGCCQWVKDMRKKYGDVI